MNISAKEENQINNLPSEADMNFFHVQEVTNQALIAPFLFSMEKKMFYSYFYVTTKNFVIWKEIL